MRNKSLKLRKEVAKLFNTEKFDEIKALLTDQCLTTENDPELYIWRGNIFYNEKKYEMAISDYSHAITIDQHYELAYYNRGLAHVAILEFDEAISDYSIIIDLYTDFADTYYTDRGNVWKAKKEYDKAISDYSEAIKINKEFANAYYNRGLAKKEKKIDLEGSKDDFEQYLKLTDDETDVSVKYAKYYIDDITERLSDKEFSKIADEVHEIIAKIKKLLRVDDDQITHYTSMTVLKSLIIDNSKFRISEGNFLNDPSEGTELYEFIFEKAQKKSMNGNDSEKFSPKPFIGSFVSAEKGDNLNMWRFYGKEKGVEAKGCSITVDVIKFIERIKDFLSNEKNKEARLYDESDVNFYTVVYVTHNDSISFHIPNQIECGDLTSSMEKLRTIVLTNDGKYLPLLEKHLNGIAYLFKRDDYKNENEVRLVVKGIEFEKKYNLEVMPPRVYIELESVKDQIKKITLGPKVDNINEWASAFYYQYEEDIPTVEFSHLPYR